MRRENLLPISRSRYLGVGLGLMILKYTGETLIHAHYTNTFLHPLSFLFPSLNLRERFLDSSNQVFALPWGYYLLTILWTLPFLWIGLTYSIRRALDANFSPWFAMGFLIPFWNFVVMSVLVLMPSVTVESQPQESKERLRAVHTVDALVRSLLLNVILFLPIIAITAFVSKSYGSLLYLVFPILAGSISSYIWNRGDEKTLVSSFGISMACLLFLGLGLILFAVEGFFCLLMALPFAFVGGFFGALIGRQIASLEGRVSPRADFSWIAVTLVIGLAVDALRPEVSERVVSSELLVNAPIEKVWNNVIAFPALNDPEELIFHMGIAYPTHATIQGSGVGAVRLCSFTTGDFVEPITTWNPPFHLAFDVREQPLPMQETSPSGEVHPPHLYYSFRSSRGEFHLVPQANGSVLLRGNTYYRLAMGPTEYWAFLSDQVVHAIHLRVLNHIKALSEKMEETQVSPPGLLRREAA